MPLTTNDPFAADPQPATAPAPQFEPGAFADALAKGFGGIADQIAAVAGRPVQVTVTPPVAPAAQPAKTEPDPLGDAVREAIAPSMTASEQRMQRLEAQLAATTDAVNFYNGTPGLTKERGAQVEAMFQGLQAKGVPMTRTDVLKWQLGNEALAKQTQDAGVSNALVAGATVGAGSPATPVSQVLRDPWSMTQQELNAAMEGREF